MTQMTMRAIRQDILGETEVLREVEMDRPVPGLSQILVRVHAAGMNPTDHGLLRGLGRHTRSARPATSPESWS